MAKRQLGLLSFGVFVVILAVSLLVFFPDLSKILALILTLYGLWGIALAGIRAKNPEKYERGAFSTLVWAILLIAVGGSWFIFIQTENFVYTVVLLLIVVGILAVASALPTMRKK